MGDYSDYANQQLLTLFPSGAGTSNPVTSNQQADNSSLFHTNSSETGTCLPFSSNQQAGNSSLFHTTSSGAGTGLPLSSSLLAKNLDDNHKFSQLSLTIRAPSPTHVFSRDCLSVLALKIHGNKIFGLIIL